MAYSISKKTKSPDMNDLIDEFESPVEYDFPSPPKTKPKIVKKKYASTIDINDINKIARKLGLNQLSLGEIKQLEKYVDEQRLLNNIEYSVALDFLLKNIKSTRSLTSAIIDTKIKLSNLKSKLRKGKGTKRRRKARNKKTMKGKKKPRKKTYRRKRK
tara:strand:+ start:360 stop:833 length:474 start_codon:yes stop_codon:yes gene_type:complete